MHACIHLIQSVLDVLEMHGDTLKLMGIQIIKDHPAFCSLIVINNTRVAKAPLRSTLQTLLERRFFPLIVSQNKTFSLNQLIVAKKNLWRGFEVV